MPKLTIKTICYRRTDQPFKYKSWAFNKHVCFLLLQMIKICGPPHVYNILMHSFNMTKQTSNRQTDIFNKQADRQTDIFNKQHDRQTDIKTNTITNKQSQMHNKLIFTVVIKSNKYQNINRILFIKKSKYFLS